MYCEWVWGETGTGKTRRAVDDAKSMGSYFIKSNNKWWDGYTDQKTVILDEADRA